MADETPINQETGADTNGEPNPLIVPEELPKAAPSMEESESGEESGELPQIASVSKAKNYLVLGAIAVFALVMLVSLLFGGKSKPPVAVEQSPPEQSAEMMAPAPPTDMPSAPTQVQPPVVNNQLPVPPVSGATPEPLPLPSPPGLPPVTGPTDIKSPPTPTLTPPANAKEEAERLKSGMLIAGGVLDKLTGGGGAGGAGGAAADKDKVEVSEAKLVGDTTNMIVQGKMIDAVLETAINSDFPGVIRAEVSRDVYAESGRKILIPKGSRLVGAYNSNVKQGQARVYIIWNRVIRPDGVSIAVDSPGVDLLGRSGVGGVIDAHYMEIFGNSILFSAIDLGFVAAAQSVTGAQGQTQTENANGSSTVSGSPVSQELSTDIQNFGGVTKGILSNLINTSPTITLDQGTPIKVFVNRDLVFNQSKEASATGVFK